MWAELKRELAAALAAAVRERFGVEHEPVLEVPPRRELGDLSSPAGMQLARVLRRPPKAIAEELAGALARPGRVRDVQVQGTGFLNFFLDRRAVAAALLEAPLLAAPALATGLIALQLPSRGRVDALLQASKRGP